jgi:hypothetical protein
MRQKAMNAPALGSDNLGHAEGVVVLVNITGVGGIENTLRR